MDVINYYMMENSYIVLMKIEELNILLSLRKIIIIFEIFLYIFIYLYYSIKNNCLWYSI